MEASLRRQGELAWVRGAGLPNAAHRSWAITIGADLLVLSRMIDALPAGTGARP